MKPQTQTQHAHPNVAVNFCPVCGTNINAVLMTLVFNMMRNGGAPKPETEVSAQSEPQSNGALTAPAPAVPAAPPNRKRQYFSVPSDVEHRILAEARRSPGKSYRAIGEQTGVSDTTVGRILKKAKKSRPKPASDTQKSAVVQLRAENPNISRRDIAERTNLTVKQVDAIIYPSKLYHPPTPTGAGVPSEPQNRE